MAFSTEQLQQNLKAMALQTSSVPDAVVERWQAEIDALRASKRPKWKGYMQNQTGVRSVVRYDPAGVSVEGLRTHFVHKLSEERKAKRCTERDWIPVLSFSARSAMANAMEQENLVMLAPTGARSVVPEGMRLDHVYSAEGEPIRGDDAAVREQIQEQIGANATGNHSARHHPIRVPTGAGQPVRG